MVKECQTAIQMKNAFEKLTYTTGHQQNIASIYCEIIVRKISYTAFVALIKESLDQDRFLCWGNGGKLVSANTYVQNISVFTKTRYQNSMRCLELGYASLEHRKNSIWEGSLELSSLMTSHFACLPKREQ